MFKCHYQNNKNVMCKLCDSNRKQHAKKIIPFRRCMSKEFERTRFSFNNLNQMRYQTELKQFVDLFPIKCFEKRIWSAWNSTNWNNIIWFCASALINSVGRVTLSQLWTTCMLILVRLALDLVVVYVWRSIYGWRKSIH